MPEQAEGSNLQAVSYAQSRAEYVSETLNRIVYVRAQRIRFGSLRTQVKHRNHRKVLNVFFYIFHTASL